MKLADEVTDVALSYVRGVDRQEVERWVDEYDEMAGLEYYYRGGQGCTVEDLAGMTLAAVARGEILKFDELSVETGLITLEFTERGRIELQLDEN